jgi:hypothetical protein
MPKPIERWLNEVIELRMSGQLELELQWPARVLPAEKNHTPADARQTQRRLAA